jgi:NitT/TauT family transport system permease protein
MSSVQDHSAIAAIPISPEAARRRLRLQLAPWVFTIVLLLVWEIACYVLKVRMFVLPPPSSIAITIVQYYRQLAFHGYHTMWMTLTGFTMAVIFGLALGLMLGASRFVYAGLYPILIGFNAIPKVAVVPILLFWFGVGYMPPILTAFLISFFPIVVNVATGIATIEPETEDVLRALGASKRDILIKVGIPRALPYFFGSLKIAITLAYVGSVIGEQNASNVGIGNLIQRATADFNVPLVWAALIVLAVLGVIMYAATAWLEAHFTGWARRSKLGG